MVDSILSIYQLLNLLWKQFSPLRKWQFACLVVLMVFTSFAEILSIGAVIPFLGALTSPHEIFTHSIGGVVFQAFGLTQPSEVVLFLASTFAISALIAGVMRLALLWGSNNFSYLTGADLSMAIYRRILYQSYEEHCARNSSEVIDSIWNKTSAIISTIMAVLTLCASTVILIAILIGLYIIDPFAASAVFGGFGFIYGVIIYRTREKHFAYSQLIARESTNVIKSLQEGLGGIRDIIIGGDQEIHCRTFRKADLLLRRTQAATQFIGNSPRYITEALGMMMIAAVAYFLTQQASGISKALPVLGALALGAQRLLPVLQQGYQSLSTIRTGRISLQDALLILAKPLPVISGDPATILPFNNGISLEKIWFRYGLSSPWVLKGLNFDFIKGERVGIIGATGSGKSTILDIVMGLLLPEEGDILVDGKPLMPDDLARWRPHIAHVPQTIFLADASIEENIAFGVPRDQIDFGRVQEAAEQAQIAKTIQSWERKYQTIVGERGVRLSGGQRQRIGIARALYKKADLIVFDEATSALDGETEAAVIEAIEELSPSLTILIIAHRLSTLKNCTKIIEIDAGVVKRIGSYKELVVNI
jgi:ABC-type multidrug transport system fused ATPase/permease subunit